MPSSMVRSGEVVRSPWEVRNETNLARVAMVYSQQTAAYYGGTKAREKVEDPALGFYQALIEALLSGLVDIVVSAHAPAPAEDTARHVGGDIFAAADPLSLGGDRVDRIVRADEIDP